MEFEVVTAGGLEELAASYARTFNAPPWNDGWTPATAKRRLEGVLSGLGTYGLCAREEGKLLGTVLGQEEQYYNGVMFNIKEFWVQNGLEGQGIGAALFAAFEARLKERGVGEIILFTAKGEAPEQFYRKQGLQPYPGLVFMGKEL